VTQPAVTKTLKELEELLGVSLFVRGRKGTTLTPEADAFVVHAQASLHSMGLAVDSVQKDASDTPLRIGLLPTLAPSFMPAILRGFASLRPGTPVRVHTGRNRQLIEMLRSKEIDLVIGRLSDPEAMLGVSFEHLYAEPLAVVLRKGHPFAQKLARRQTTLRALSAVPMVLPLSGTMIRQIADAFLARHGIAPQAGLVETLDTALALGLVLSGDCVWLTPLGAAQPDLESGRIVKLPVTISPEEPVGLMLRSDISASAPLQVLLGLVREQAAVKRAAAGRPSKRRK
jgi:LysR family pca operon transcriptional activator